MIFQKNNMFEVTKLLGYKKYNIAIILKLNIQTLYRPI